jgi:iron(III) transport system substrate-binding protein
MIVFSRRRVIASLAMAAAGVSARAGRAFDPDGALLAAANKEGRLVLYSASLIELIQRTIKDFNKRFPGIEVQVVRASGGALIERVRTEAAQGKLVADVIEHSDRGEAKAIEALFADYRPPNGADYLPETMASPRLWPASTLAWCIAWNAERVKTPPRTWMDLCKAEYAGGRIGQVIASSGGTTWTRVMFERQVLGEAYWTRQAATAPKLYPGGSALCEAIIKGEVETGPLLMSIAFAKENEGAPLDMTYPPEGVPVTPFAAGIAANAKHPNAARLWMDWTLSEEGQAGAILNQGNLTSLRVPPFAAPVFDPHVNQVWSPDFGQFQALRDPWIDDWNKVYGYKK